MSFWSTEKLRRELTKSKIVQSADKTLASASIVVNGAFELSLGPEAFLTTADNNTKQILKEGEQLAIPPGQFGLLLTEETVSIPIHAIGFISIKAGIKFRGLVNVSGFHVDPGFTGRLKFAVYNAGSQNIVLERRQPVFLLWLSDLDQPTKPYSGVHGNQNNISPDDVMRIHGEIASPGQLKKEIQELGIKLDQKVHSLEAKITNLKLILTTLLTLGLSVLAFTLRGCVQPKLGQSQSAVLTDQPAHTTNVATAIHLQPKLAQTNNLPGAGSGP